ncbi:MAG: hypothetical protein LBQ79_08905 [Deltaproteobacteria bacterium]|jgi:hypothetical protein|nr:hypothetical protein [Deltaproteobacteria bacterium]
MATGKKKDTAPALLAPEDEFMAIAAGLKAQCPEGFPADLFKDYCKSVFSFVESFRATAAAADSGGLSSSRLEELLADLARSQNGLNLKLLKSELGKFDQHPLIEKKKNEARERGERIKVYRHATRTLITSVGPFEFTRLSMIRSRGQAERDRVHWRRWDMLFPLDEAMGISRLPFKMTCGAMLEISRRAALTLSYDSARDVVLEECFIKTTGVTVRSITSRVGELVVAAELKRADEARKDWQTRLSRGTVPPSSLAAPLLPRDASSGRFRKAEDVGFDPEDLECREDELCIAVSETPIILRDSSTPQSDKIRLAAIFVPKPSEGNPFAGRTEYVPYIGLLEPFKSLVLAASLRAGLEEAPGAVIISDGAPWAREMRDELFPAARLLLDLGLVEKEIRQFASPEPVQIGTPGSKTEKVLARIVDMALAGIVDMVFRGRSTEAFEEARKIAPGTRPRGHHRLMKLLKGPGPFGGPPGGFYREGFSRALGPAVRSQIGFLEGRLRRSGMRWKLHHAQSILALTAKEISGLWESDVEPRIRDVYGYKPSGPPQKERQAQA